MANTDCGGRAPSYDVIDATYTGLAGAAATDGVASDGKPSDTAFPFLADPN
jgi:hypothetical protein